jgi:hypothetical protein
MSSINPAILREPPTPEVKPVKPESSASILPRSDQPSLDLLLLAILFVMAIMGGLTFFIKPMYESGASALIQVLITSFSGACGAKWGLSQSPTKPSVEHPPVVPTAVTEPK